MRHHVYVSAELGQWESARWVKIESAATTQNISLVTGVFCSPQIVLFAMLADYSFNLGVYTDFDSSVESKVNLHYTVTYQETMRTSP